MKKSLILWSVLAVAALFVVSAIQATEQMTEELGINCTACHDKPGSKLLTSKGKYFEMTGSFEGYDDVIRKYRKCTKCHSKYPGSEKLTKKGERLKAKGKTMEHVVTEPAE